VRVPRRHAVVASPRTRNHLASLLGGPTKLSSDRWSKIGRLLDELLDLEPGERSAYLEQACAGDAALRTDIELLLRDCDEAVDFLEQPAAEYAAPLVRHLEDQVPAPTGGMRVGPYLIVREAGHGGMGTVYLAEREGDWPPMQVALKLIRPGPALDGQLTRRFLEEREILASLNHPHIARLLDGGVTADGRPWFAMEFVQGTPLDRYAREQPLSVEDRLRLFLTICEAVDYAHRNLVVHRDLKPANILVTADGGVKLLDFGIAKLIGGARARLSVGVRPMTLEYVSPEQIRGEEVTIASDVYSLGVLLYELLTGQRPYDSTPRDRPEIARAILETDARAPSEIADEEVGKTLRGEIDSILLKALQKEPSSRYPSAVALANDLRRACDAEATRLT
jgi:serine/threonine protein kinase